MDASSTTIPRTLQRGPPPPPNVPATVSLPKLRGYDTHELTIVDLQRHFAKRQFTSADYVAHCLDHIHRTNPYLEAVIETNPDALSIARERDLEREAGHVRGPLHGVPVLVKDNMATQDAMQTTAGSWALLGSVVPRDAFVVDRLRAAGAVVLGHSNMCEWFSIRSRSYSTGFSPRGGQTRNPYDLSRDPGGSSSGSAVGVAANLVPIALGTETDTSIITPAAQNGIVGIKPTVGLTSRSGVIPASENLDSVGPFGRTVADAVAVLDAIAAPDEDDPFTTVHERQQPSSYLSCLATREALRGARFGLVMKRCWESAPEEDKAVARRVFDALHRAGAEIVEVDLPSVDERVGESGSWDWEHGAPDASEFTVCRADAYRGINAYLAGLEDGPVRSLEEVVAYNRANAGTEGGVAGVAPAFPDGQPYFEEVVSCGGVRDETYHKALAHIRRQTRENGIDAALRGLDALLFCDRPRIGQQYAAQAGYPIVCIPIGVNAKGAPVALSLQHTAWREDVLIKWASAIEDLWNRENGWRPLPTFRNLHAKNVPIEKW